MRFTLPTWLYFGGIVVPIILLSVLAGLSPEQLSQMPIMCLSRNIFGIECLGCGMTRAISALLHGNFSQAIHYNHFVVLLVPIILASILYCSRELLRLQQVQSVRYRGNSISGRKK